MESSAAADTNGGRYPSVGTEGSYRPPGFSNDKLLVHLGEQSEKWPQPQDSGYIFSPSAVSDDNTLPNSDEPSVQQQHQGAWPQPHQEHYKSTYDPKGAAGKDESRSSIWSGSSALTDADCTADAEGAEAAKPPRRRLSGRQKLMAVLVLLVAVASILVLSVPGVTEALIEFMEYLQEEQLTGALIFTAIFALSIVLTIPSVLFGIGAGFVFPYEVAIPVVYVSSLIGAAANFAIGRYLFSEMVEIMCLSRSGSMREINSMLGGANSWRLITLLRLPYLGMPQVSYLLSASQASFRHYIIGTALGIIPVSVMFSIIGRQLGDLSSATSGASLVLTVSLLVGTILVVCGVVVYARRALRRNARGPLIEEDATVATRDADFAPLPSGEELPNAAT